MITVAARISLNAGALVTMKVVGNEGRGACEGVKEKRSELASLSEQGGGAEGAEGGREEGESQSAWEGGSERAREGFVFELAARQPSQPNRRCTLQGRCSPSRRRLVPAHSAESVDDLSHNREAGVCNHGIHCGEARKQLCLRYEICCWGVGLCLARRRSNRRDRPLTS